MKTTIKKVAVLGSGVMGSRIACHFANIGVQVLLLDIVPKELNAIEQATGKILEQASVRNRIVNEALQAALKSNPSPIYSKKFAGRITTGNFDDDLAKISSCDWVVEVIVERLDIKRSLFEKVDALRKPGTLITTNTSGIPIHLLIEGRSEDFKSHFCGTHFFNPPRYLKLLEIIPSVHTKTEVIEFLSDYGIRYLGKNTVLCKDTPAFIANRVGVYSIQALFHLVKEMGLTVEEVDKLTGPVLGRPKSATFRTCDVVGLDTLIHVANGVRENCPHDEARSAFEIPDYVQKMSELKRFGDKTGEGFYKKIKDSNGKSEILSMNLQTLEYGPQHKAKFATLESTKTIDSLIQRLPVLFKGKDKAGEFYRKSFSGLFAYVSNRIPEISDNIFSIDDAMRAGFGWQLGPFESWDIIGLETGISEAEKNGHSIAAWIKKMVADGNKSFYKIESGIRYYYDVSAGSYKPVPAPEGQIVLAHIPESEVVWKNNGCIIRHLGDGILCCSWDTKMNTIGGEVIEGLNKAVDLAEKEYRGLVLYNDGENFSAGANVGMIFMLAVEQEYEELDMAIRTFQRTVMRMRHSSIPVVGAPHNLALGGGCELNLHVDKVIAHAETYMGLVEMGVGVIPAGAGSKEFALRLSDEIKDGDIKLNAFRNRFLTIGQAKVSTSAHEAFELGYLRIGIDEVVVSRELQLARAKEACLELAENGYTQPELRKDITVLGQEALGIVYVGANSMKSGHYISEHDQLISEKLGFVIAGGDLSAPTQVSETYLLDLERKAFLELCKQKKSLERMQSLVTSGKILRN
ncbi:MAG: 3-hydroxyacyl-CoA dehydrogenase NAD-binding domain-containing protein [Flavobacteriales bacterium]|nr:3-hydroxyacyl-CoA dehydrogenase NAD-binding domain-containing protein [Flavobacteriales bacterium]